MRMGILPALLTPSVEQLTLLEGCAVKVMEEIIETCATVTQIQMDDSFPPTDGRRQKWQTVATRNRALARFVATPRAYPGDELLALMTQFDKSPTGRYMLARCLPAIPFLPFMTTT